MEHVVKQGKGLLRPMHEHPVEASKAERRVMHLERVDRGIKMEVVGAVGWMLFLIGLAC